MTDSEIAFRPMLLEEFTPLIGKVFTAECEPKSVDIRLVEAYPLHDSPMASRPPFMLIFHTPIEVLLVDGSYILRCGHWGPDRISIGCAMATPDGEPGHYYQAVFN
jgi:hypothetical protein